MRYKFRMFNHKDDNIKVRDFLSKTLNNTGEICNWTIDRWNFVQAFSIVMHSTEEFWYNNIGIWENDKGEIISIVNTEGEEHGEVFFQIDYSKINNDILSEMFDFAEKNLPWTVDGVKQLNLRIPEKHKFIEDMAISRGFIKTEYKETFSVLALKEKFEINLPEGFTFEYGVNLTPERKAEAHSKAFGYHGTQYVPLCEKGYARLLNAYDYNKECDLYVISPTGEISSFCTVWYDENNKMGILEPVGTHPDYRKMDLAKNVIYEGINRIIEKGAQNVSVGSAQEFYLKIGFEKKFLNYLWNKKY